MALKQQLQQRLTQRLSPQQIQVIRLLELTSVELEEKIAQEVIDNPALEETTEPVGSDMDSDAHIAEDTNFDADGQEDLSLGDYLTEDDIPSYKIEQNEQRGENARQLEIPFVGGISIGEHLSQQLGMQDLSSQDKKIAEYIIWNIDDDGYLRRPLQSISDDLIFQLDIDAPPEHLQKILDIIHDLDPPGIGASDLQECLKLQLLRKEPNENILTAIKIIDTFFDDFSKRHYDKIQKQLNIDGEKLRNVIKEITQLNPRPGGVLSASESEKANSIIPDFNVTEDGGEITFSLNGSNIPELRVSPEYINMYNDYLGNKQNRTRQKHDALLFVKQKLDSAQWFISAVKQRQETMMKTMGAIISLQKEFFISGNEQDLRPMILKDVASAAGYDISTISRTVNGKYVQTELGIFPLKYFFSESMQNSAGEEISSREIKKMLLEFVDSEDKKDPLSDDALCEKLREKGYKIARRTVAKYREQAGIAVARLRKEL